MLLFAILISSLSQAAQPMITVRQNTILTRAKEHLTLGDIATFENMSAEEKSRCAETPISDAPKDNEKRIFTSYAISEVLRGIAKTTNIKTVLPQKIQVVTRLNPIHEDRLRQELLNFYQPITTAQIEVEELRINEKIDGTILDVKYNFKSEIPKGSFTLPIEVRTDHGIKTVWLTGKIKLLLDVPVIKRAVQAGERITGDDIITEKRDVTFSTDTIADAKDLMAATAGRVLSAKSILWKGVLLRTHAFKVGEVVKLISGTDAWQVTTSGVAQQTGFVGDVVSVLNPSTKKIVSGMIIDKGMVKVQ